jgi:hypothetical protein
MITARDQSIINFLEEFHIATSEQIQKLFFSPKNYRYCMQRLRYLSDNLFVRRTRSTINNCYAYYVDSKPVQIHHDLIRSEVYATIKSLYNVLEWHNEVPIGNIRPDALCYIKEKSMIYPVLLEVHLNNKFDFDKYRMDFIPLFGMNPRIIICTDRHISLPDRKFRLVGIDMSGIESFLK